MTPLVPLPLVIPLCAAALSVISARGRLKMLSNAIPILAGLGTCGVCAAVLRLVWSGGTIVYWMGGWSPEGHVGIGIDFAVDAAGAAGALLVSAIVTLIIVYSSQYYEQSGPLFNVLTLTVMGALCAFFYTGDIFDMFVFFELSNVALFALSAYKVRDATALDGALTFVITNSVAAFGVLFGLTLLEGYTDQLNLATIGRFLEVHPSSGIAVAALALIAAGFLLRAALAPFHAWLADAQASAPSPVCALISGVSVTAALYGIARIYWTTFSGAHFDQAILSDGLAALGGVSALFGAIMAFGAHHLKRVAAFVTVSQTGLVVLALALLRPAGIAAAIAMAAPAAAASAALFCAIGIIVHRYGSADELRLWGRGRSTPLAGVLYGVCALALSGLPAAGPFAGRAIMLAGTGAYRPFFAAVLLLTGAIAGGALLKGWGSIFFGWGDPDPALTRAQRKNGDEPQEQDQPEDTSIHPFLWAPALLLCLGSVGVGYWPAFWMGAMHEAARFVDRRHYYAMTVYGHAAPVHPWSIAPAWGFAAAIGAAAFAGAVLLALASLYQRRIPALHATASRLAKPMQWLERLHDGQIGDYVTWYTLGAALLGGICLAAYR